MIQRWTTAAFVHWRVDQAAVERLLPPHLRVDAFDGSAWIGLVPFEMRMRPPFAPPLPRLPRYPETNVRTYVRDGYGRRGLWFLSLDVPRWPAVLGARTALGLPYAWSRISIDRANGSVEYRAERRAPDHGATSSVVLPADRGVADDSDLARFLTARFRMFATGPLGRTRSRWSTNRGNHVACRTSASGTISFGSPASKSTNDRTTSWSPRVYTCGSGCSPI